MNQVAAPAQRTLSKGNDWISSSPYIEPGNKIYASRPLAWSNGTLLLSSGARVQEDAAEQVRQVEARATRNYQSWHHLRQPISTVRVSGPLSVHQGSLLLNPELRWGAAGEPSSSTMMLRLQNISEYLDLFAYTAEASIANQLQSWQETVLARVRSLIAGSIDAPQSIVLLVTTPSKNIEYEVWPAVASQPLESVPLARVREELQIWFSASLEEMANLLGIAYATFVNIAKDARSPRPGSLRKIFAVHGRAKELRRVWGATRAESWLRTAGRDMLAKGNLADFEVFVDRILFPAERRSRVGAKAAREEAELSIAGRQEPPTPSGFRRR